jgi:hypothetical protein
MDMKRAAITAMIVSAIGSLALMLRMARNQQSIVLVVVFILWDSAPFVLLGLAQWFAATWDRRKQVALHAVSIAVSIGSFAAYLLDTLGPPHPQAAFIYVIVPPVLVAAASIVLLTAHRLYNVK